MRAHDDPGRHRVVEAFGATDAALVGRGSEAHVYALDGDRVLRVLDVGGHAHELRRRQELIARLVQARPSFALPEIYAVGEIDGRAYSVERRLPGRSLLDELASTDPAARAALIEAHLTAAAALGDLALDHADGYGDLLADSPIVAPAWHDYLEQRAACNLSRSTPEFWSVDAAALADDLPAARSPAFVHLDAFAGNMLTDGRRITAVIDIGITCVAGDRRLDPVASAIYLASPDITPTAVARDIGVARSWLRSAGLDDLVEPARRWLAALWSFAVDDPATLRWCRDILLDGI